MCYKPVSETGCWARWTFSLTENKYYIAFNLAFQLSEVDGRKKNTLQFLIASKSNAHKHHDKSYSF